MKVKDMKKFLSIVDEDLELFMWQKDNDSYEKDHSLSVGKPTVYTPTPDMKDVVLID